MFNSGSANAYAGGSTAFGEAMTSLRFVWAKPGDNIPAHDVSASGAAPGASATLYENPYALPLAFYADEETVRRAQSVPAYNWTATQTFDTQNAVFAALSGAAAPLFSDIATVSAEAEGKACALTGDFGAQLTYTVTVPQGGLVYAVLESKQGRPVLYETSTGFSGGYFSGWPSGALQLGRCEAGDTVTLTLTAEWGLMDVTAARFAVLDEEALSAYTKAAQAAAPAQQTLRRGSFTVQTGAAQDTLLVTTLPYDEALRATVDGEEAALVPLFDDLCAVRVPAGQRTVRIAYHVPYLAAGAALTAFFAVALLAAWCLQKKSKRKGEQ